MDRRKFICSMGTAFGTLLTSANSRAKTIEPNPEFFSILIDTTRCEGCQSCEYACAEKNGLPEPEMDESVFENTRKTSIIQRTVVNRFQTDKGEIFVKKQCMHCNQPACASACLTKAMTKTVEGPVLWRESKCMGCRFCMVSCPFDVPKLEYDSAVPKIHKCGMCADNLAKGELPACVENCPNEALMIGKRSEIINTARKRILDNPDKYHNYIYGENEAGGTGVMYLASVPFEQLGFKTNLGTKPYPEYTKGFLYSVPIVLILWPAFLLAMSNATKKEETIEKESEV